MNWRISPAPTTPASDQLAGAIGGPGRRRPDVPRPAARRDQLARAGSAGRYGQRLTIGEDQVKAYQKRLETEAGKPRFQISEVFIDASRAGGEAAAEQGAAQLIAQLKKGAPFAAVARQFSNSPSAANGW